MQQAAICGTSSRTFHTMSRSQLTLHWTLNHARNELFSARAPLPNIHDSRHLQRNRTRVSGCTRGHMSLVTRGRDVFKSFMACASLLPACGGIASQAADVP